MKYNAWIAIASMLFTHTIQPRIEYDLYQLHSHISYLAQHVHPSAHLPQRIYEHLQNHKYISWKTAFPDIQFATDIKPNLKNIKHTTKELIYNIASHNYKLSLTEELQKYNILTQSFAITPKYQDIIHEPPRIIPFVPWWVFSLQATPHTPTSSTNNAFMTLSRFITQPRTQRLQELNDAIRLAQNTYKIHLMPYTKDLTRTISRLLDAYSQLPEDQRYIKAFKFSPHIHLQLSRTIPSTGELIGELLPRIVIYPIANKEYAQEILKWLLTVFTDQYGLDVYPRFNQRVTSLIYYSQGNADDRYDEATSYAFAPKTGYTFIDVDAIKQTAANAGISEDQLQLNNTQKLIHPNTGTPF